MVDWWIARVSSNFHMYLRAHVGASHGGCLETRRASGSNVFVTNRYEIFVRQDIPFQPRTNFDVARTPPCVVFVNTRSGQNLIATKYEIILHNPHQKKML